MIKVLNVRKETESSDILVTLQYEETGAMTWFTISSRDAHDFAMKLLKNVTPCCKEKKLKEALK